MVPARYFVVTLLSVAVYGLTGRCRRASAFRVMLHAVAPRTEWGDRGVPGSGAVARGGGDLRWWGATRIQGGRFAASLLSLLLPLSKDAGA